MPRNTKIQFRRGTAAQWTDTGLAALDVGEIGYEIDTGRFKIGKSGVHLWSELPYTGIGLIFDQATNAYTAYSVITGVAGFPQELSDLLDLQFHAATTSNSCKILPTFDKDKEGDLSISICFNEISIILNDNGTWYYSKPTNNC